MDDKDWGGIDDGDEQIADRLRSERPELSALTLDAIHQRVVTRASRGRFGRSRLAGALAVVGLMAAGTGGVVAAGGFGGASRPDAAVAQYLSPASQSPATTTGSPSGGVLGVTQTSTACASLRHFTIHLLIPRHDHVVSAQVFLNGKRLQLLTGKRLHAHINLRGLPKGRDVLTITARTKHGKVLRGKRVYHTCLPVRLQSVPLL